MSVVFPKLDELYCSIINDCNRFQMLQYHKNEKKPIIIELYKPKTNKNEIINILNVLLTYMSKNSSKDKKCLPITFFTSMYMNNIFEFYSKETNNIEVKYYDKYCLAYIALVGFRYFFSDLNDNELFEFQSTNCENFSNFLCKYSLLKQLKEYYDTYSTEVKAKYNNDTNLYLNLILKFDTDCRFSKQLQQNLEIPSNDNKDNNKNLSYAESMNGTELSSAQGISGKKANIYTNSNNNIEIKKSKNNIYKSNNDIINDKKDSSIEILNNNKEIIEIDQDRKFYEPAKPEDMNINRENNKNEKMLTISDVQLYVNERIFDLEFQLRKSDLENIKLIYEIYEESTFNSLYFNVSKKHIEYLEAYNKSLKITISNLSNPYNFNLWRKIANIILKNIFPILKHNNKFEIVQNQNLSVIEEIEKIVKTKKNSELKKEYLKKIQIIKNKLKPKKDPKGTKANTNTLSPSGDKIRKFNLITIKKDNKYDINSSLSVDFLFHVKEKGNMVDHFDELILNLVLFNDLNISDDEIKDKEEKYCEIKNIKNVKNIKKKEDVKNNNINLNEANDVDKIMDNSKKEDNINNDVKKTNKITKITKVKNIEKNKIENIKQEIDAKKDDANNKKKDEIINENWDKNIITKINIENKKNKKCIKEVKDSNNKIKEVKDEEKEIIGKKNENKEANSKNKNIIKKTNGINYLNKEYEGKKIFTGNEIIEMLKNPLIFQRKNIQKKNLFNEIYKNIDNLKKEIGFDKKEKTIIEFLKRAKDLESHIKELMENMENDINKNNDDNNLDIKNIKEKKNFENIAPSLQKKINKYFELKDMFCEINKKIKVYEKSNKKFIKLNETIINSEKEIDDSLKEIQKRIEKGAKLITIEDIFNDYKSSLIKKPIDDSEYKEHSDIFDAKNINNFKLEDLYNFLKIHLAGKNFSISKRDIINYNLYIKILNSFDKLKDRYMPNVDVEL